MQARLRYWNYSTNLLTRMFSLEYGYWFGTMLPGLDRMALPIPLGGTSNHFRVPELRALIGWDPTTSPRTPTSACGPPSRATASA